MITTTQTSALVGFYAAAKQARHIWPAAAACEAVVETSWGTSQLYREAHNIFGMKQHVHPIYGTVKMPTKEVIGGEVVTIDAVFVNYPTDAAAFADRMATLMRLAPQTGYEHYAKALKSLTPEQYLTEVSAKWSTGPQRGAECIAVLHAHKDALCS